MRPFYIIGHNTNSIAKVKKALQKGANAIESDFDGSFNHMTVNDTDLGDSDGPHAPQFFQDLGNLIPDFPQLSLVVLDRKHHGASAGAQLLRLAREALSSASIGIVVSVSELGKGSAFYDICDQMGPREALMIDQKDDSAAMMDWFSSRGATRVAYGDDNIAVAIDHASR